MLVCHCYGISDRDLRQAAARGARNCEDLDLECPAAQGCGGCAPAVDEILGQFQARAAAGAGHEPGQPIVLDKAGQDVE